MLRSFANDGMCAHAAHRSPTYEAVEICDCRGLDPGSRQKNMEQRPGRAEQLQTPWNGKRCCRGRAVVAVSFECSACQLRHQTGRSEHAQGDSGFFEKTSTTQEPLSEVTMTRIGRCKGIVGS